MDDAPPVRVTVNGEPISEVSSLKYLGVRFNAEAYVSCQTSSGTRTNRETGSNMAKSALL